MYPLPKTVVQCKSCKRQNLTLSFALSLPGNNEYAYEWTCVRIEKVLSSTEQHATRPSSVPSRDWWIRCQERFPLQHALIMVANHGRLLAALRLANQRFRANTHCEKIPAHWTFLPRNDPPANSHAHSAAGRHLSKQCRQFVWCKMQHTTGVACASLRVCFPLITDACNSAQAAQTILAKGAYAFPKNQTVLRRHIFRQPGSVFKNYSRTLWLFICSLRRASCTPEMLPLCFT